MKKIIIFFLFLFSIFNGIAGSRGYYVVMLNIGDKEFYEFPIYQDFINNLNMLPEAIKCWKKTPAMEDRVGSVFDRIARKKIPTGLTLDLGNSIWGGDIKAIEMARKILKKPDSNARSEGYDGMYILKPDGNTLSLMAIGARGGVSVKININLDSSNPKKSAADFDHALCKVSKPFEIGFGY